MFAGTLAVFFNTAIQHKVGILHRLVVDEPVQLGAVKAVVRYLVLHGDTVDGNPVSYTHLKPFKLLPWQEKIIRDVFGTVRDEDPSMRQYNQVYIEIGKKNGKSELGAALALNMLINDDEWKAEVYSCASDRQQAAIVFDVAVDMVRQNPTLSKLIKIIQGIAVYGGRHLKGGCKMRTA